VGGRCSGAVARVGDLAGSRGGAGMLLLMCCFPPPSPAVPAVDAGAGPPQRPRPARLLSHRRPARAAGGPEAPGRVAGRERRHVRAERRGLGGCRSRLGGSGWGGRAWRSVELSRGPSRSRRRPLHLAIIHEQTAVVKQLIEVIVSIPGQQIINMANNLQQVRRSLGRPVPLCRGLAPASRPQGLLLMLLRLGAGCGAERGAAAAGLGPSRGQCCCCRPADAAASGSRHQAAPGGAAPAASPC